MRVSLKWTGIVAAGLLLAACAGLSLRDFARGYAEGRASALAAYDNQTQTPAQRGAVAFTLSDFGALNTDTLETHATPWRLAAAALVLADVDAHGGAVEPERIRSVMSRYGFLYPERIGNWPEGLAAPAPALEAPLGLSLGVVERDVPNIRLTAANLACAACHAGASFDAAGAPVTQVAWLGTPNTSLDLEAYVQGVYGAFKQVRGDETRLLGAVRALFPDTSAAEMQTLRSFGLPRMRARLDALARAEDRPLPFVNGAPGLTNGVAALRMQLGLLPANGYETARGFTSIPDLGARGFRSALLYDGAYAPPGAEPQRRIDANDITPAHLNGLATVTAFFTVPSMGVAPDRAALHLNEARDVFSFLDTYAPPRFPGRIDQTRAAQGQALYVRRCASCHGIYDDSLARPRLQSFPNWLGSVGTDPVRVQSFDDAAAAAVMNSGYGDRILARATGLYAAPLLSGVWMSAPYLHNGSVPTLWQLMNPGERPARFMVGGHRLDYEHLGIDGVLNVDGEYAYPNGYQPWSQPRLIDTSARAASPIGAMNGPSKASLTLKSAR